MSNHEIATASVDGYVRCYDIRAGKLRTDFMDDPVTCVRFSHDGNCMLVSALDNTVRCSYLYCLHACMYTMTSAPDDATG